MVTASGYLVVANVGDSSAVLCCDANGEGEQLTVDHTPRMAEEVERIESLGGFVAGTASTPRVNGEIAVSRSIGNLPLKRLLPAVSVKEAASRG